MKYFCEFCGYLNCRDEKVGRIVCEVCGRTTYVRPYVIGIEGPPASGRSTMAVDLDRALTDKGFETSVILDPEKIVMQKMGIKDLNEIRRTSKWSDFQTAVIEILLHKPNVDYVISDGTIYDAYICWLFRSKWEDIKSIKLPNKIYNALFILEHLRSHNQFIACYEQILKNWLGHRAVYVPAMRVEDRLEYVLRWLI